MILIKPYVKTLIDDYVNYLINEGITSKERASEKKNLMIQAINNNLGGIRSFPFSQYKSFGAPQGHRLYVYKDPKSKTQWGFTHQEFDDENDNINVIIYNMRNMKLVTENFISNS